MLRVDDWEKTEKSLSCALLRFIARIGMNVDESRTHPERCKEWLPPSLSLSLSLTYLSLSLFHPMLSRGWARSSLSAQVVPVGFDSLSLSFSSR